MGASRRVHIGPQDGGQLVFLSRTEFEVLGGGAAGGGKSWALVFDALGLQFKTSTLGRAAYEMPGYRAILYRRETPQLAKLIDIAKELYPVFGGRWVGHRVGAPGPGFEFPSGAMIFFAHMENESDKENVQGHEFQFVGFDELTHFTLTQYLYLYSRCRSVIPGLFPRLRATSNPTSEGLWWVKKRFIRGLKPLEPHRFLSAPDPEQDPQGVLVKPGDPHFDRALSRVFVPMWLQENKILMQHDPLYATRIMGMGLQMEKALLHGDWDAFGGDFFIGWRPQEAVVDPFAIPKEWKLIGSVDPGFSSPCSFGLTAVDFKGNYYRIATYYVRQQTPDEHAKAIREFITKCTWTGGRWPERIVSGTDAFAKADRYAVIATDKTFADVFAEFGLLLDRATTDRKNGWWNWKNLMPGHYFVFRGLNDPLLDEMAAAVSDEKSPEDIKGKGNDPNVMDHALDEQRYGLMALQEVAEAKPVERTWDYKIIWGDEAPHAGWRVGSG